MGNLTYINVSELNVQDPFILLNASNTGAYSANSGVLTHISSSSFAGIRYSSGTNRWEISTDTGVTGETGVWQAIQVGNAAGAGGSNTQVQFNDGGSLAGNGNFTFDKTSSKVTVNGPFVLGNLGTTPTSTSNSATLYNNVEGSGGTGVYVKSSTVDDELVSKSAAIVFAIIF